MNFELTKEQKMLQEVTRDFAENEVKPLAAEIDRDKRIPTETIEKMAELGWFGLTFPKELGGAEVDEVGYAIVVEELAKKYASTALFIREKPTPLL